MSRARQIVEAETKNPVRACLLVYFPRRGYKHKYAVCVVEGTHTPAQTMRLIRAGAEKLAGRRLSWSQGDLQIKEDHLDPAAATAPGFDKIIIAPDGSLNIQREPPADD